MALSPETALRWSQTYSISALRALFWLSMVSEASLQADPAGQGWTEPLSRRDIMEAAKVSRSQSVAVSKALEAEAEIGARVGQKTSYRLIDSVSQCETPGREVDRDVRHDPEGVSEGETVEVDAGVSEGETPCEIEEFPEVDRDVRHQPSSVSEYETEEQQFYERYRSVMPQVDRDVRHDPEGVSEGETPGPERAGVKESFTKDSTDHNPDQADHRDNPPTPTPDPNPGRDAHRDNASTPSAAEAVDPQVRALLKLSVKKIMGLLGQGKFPRDRAMEIAVGEQIVAEAEGRDYRKSLVQRVTEFAHSIPATLLNPMFSAVVEAFGYDPDALTRDERGGINLAAVQLVEAQRKPEDVQVIYDYCKRQNWSTDFGPPALPKHATAALKQRRSEPDYSDYETSDEEFEARMQRPRYPDWWEAGLDRVGPERLTMRDAWLITVSQLEVQLNSGTFNMRIKPLRPARFEDRLLLLAAEGSAGPLAEQIKFQIARALDRTYGEPVEIEIRALDAVLEDEVAV